MSQKVDDGTGTGWSIAIPIRGGRGNGTFTIDESDAGTTYISATTVAYWVGTLTDAEARNVARDIMSFAADGNIRPNDKITLTDISNQLSGTRVYFGPARKLADINLIVASDFGGLVTEVIDANLLINGSISADKLSADIISGDIINAIRLVGVVVTSPTIQTNSDPGSNGGIKVTENTLTVYDDSGTVRVKLGQLS